MHYLQNLELLHLIQSEIAEIHLKQNLLLVGDKYKYSSISQLALVQSNLFEVKFNANFKIFYI